CAPCDRSSTVSLSGQRVVAMRRRRSSRAACGTWILKGRMVVSPVVVVCAELEAANTNTPTESAAIEAARKPCRVDDEKRAVSIFRPHTRGQALLTSVLGHANRNMSLADRLVSHDMFRTWCRRCERAGRYGLSPVLRN